jgi:hypothetical protein
MILASTPPPFEPLESVATLPAPDGKITAVG